MAFPSVSINLVLVCLFLGSVHCTLKPHHARARVGHAHNDKYDKILQLRGGLRELSFEGVKELANRRNDAQNLLNNIKVPASLFAGAALGGMYINEAKTAHKRLRMLFLVASNMALVCMMLTVFTSTVCFWRLMGDGYDPMAYTAADLLLKYFDYEYLSISVSFFFGLCFFLLSTILRVTITFGNSYETAVLSALNLMVMFYMIRFYDHAIISKDDGLWGVITHLAERSLVVLPKIFINLEFAVFLVAMGSLGAYVQKVLREDEKKMDMINTQGGNSPPALRKTVYAGAAISMGAGAAALTDSMPGAQGPDHANN